MHEYSLVVGLIEEVERQARRHGAVAVHRVHVRIGELAGVDADLFATAYEAARAHTMCERAELSLESVSALWRCPSCHATLRPDDGLRCPRCGTPGRSDGARDLVLQRLELEIPDV